GKRGWERGEAPSEEGDNTGVYRPGGGRTAGVADKPRHPPLASAPARTLWLFSSPQPASKGPAVEVQRCPISHLRADEPVPTGAGSRSAGKGSILKKEIAPMAKNNFGVLFAVIPAPPVLILKTQSPTSGVHCLWKRSQPNVTG